MKKLLSILILGMFFISFASALNIIEEIDVETNITLTCKNDGACSASAYCNINLVSPSSLVILNGINMSRNGEIFYENITPEELGDYTVTGFCKDGAVSEEVDYQFKVTNTGEDLNIYKTIIILVGITLIILFSIYCIYLGKNSKQDGPKLVLYSLAFFFGLFAVGIVSSIIQQNLFGFGTVSGVFSSFYILLTILSGVLILGLIIWLIVSTLEKWNKMRGYTDNFNMETEF